MAIPDENIHPTATGNAAKTVAEHQAKQDLVFYSGWVSFSTPSFPSNTLMQMCVSSSSVLSTSVSGFP
jgi:hypothetical protein